MTPRAILLTTWVAGGMAWTPNTLAQDAIKQLRKDLAPIEKTIAAMTCMNEQVLAKKLLELRGESVIFAASMGEHNGQIGVFLNPVSGTWTLVTDDFVDPSQGANVVACIRAQGRDGSAFPPRDRGQPS